MLLTHAAEQVADTCHEVLAFCTVSAWMHGEKGLYRGRYSRRLKLLDRKQHPQVCYHAVKSGSRRHQAAVALRLAVVFVLHALNELCRAPHRFKRLRSMQTTSAWDCTTAPQQQVVPTDRSESTIILPARPFEHCRQVVCLVSRRLSLHDKYERRVQRGILTWLARYIEIVSSVCTASCKDSFTPVTIWTHTGKNKPASSTVRVRNGSKASRRQAQRAYCKAREYT